MLFQPIPLSDADIENELKETFRVFSKDNEGRTE